MAWITTADLLAEAAPILGFDAAHPPQRVTDLLARCVADGYADLTNILMIRGYTQAQLDAWDNRARYSLDQSLYWLLLKATGVAEYDQQGVPQLDHRKELRESAAIMIGGSVVAPGTGGNGTPSVIGFGVMDIARPTWRDRETFR